MPRCWTGGAPAAAVLGDGHVRRDVRLHVFGRRGGDLHANSRLLGREQPAELRLEPEESVAACVVAVERSGEVVDRAAAATTPEAVPAALGRVIDMEARLGIGVERARHL